MDRGNQLLIVLYIIYKDKLVETYSSRFISISRILLVLQVFRSLFKESNLPLFSEFNYKT